MATRYESGRQFEYRTRDALLKKGALYVMRAASSKGAADLIALWPMLSVLSEKPWLVQCKRDGKLPRKEREVLVELAKKTGTVAKLARIPKSGRGVEFIDLWVTNRTEATNVIGSNAGDVETA